MDALRTSFAELNNQNVLARGEGRSYGDASLNPDGYTIIMTRLKRIIHFDEETGVLCCEAGLTFRDVAEAFVPRGWFPVVTPGTQFVTIGGAVAFDVHGKNHHVDGSFCHHVRSLSVLIASGETVSCSRAERQELFWATVGGMGLTGIIVEVEFSLRRIETAYISSLVLKARNLDEAFLLFDKNDGNHNYSVAWIDCLATGGSLGRSIIHLGDHARPVELDSKRSRNPLAVKAKRRLTVPLDLPGGALNKVSVGLFNALYFHGHTGSVRRDLIDWDAFFYPLDFLQDWNRLYGKRGFTQYQFVVPIDRARDAVSKVLTVVSGKGLGSFLSVLKRLGNQEGWLSFPQPGYTLAIDIPVKAGLSDVLDELDRIVVDHGGRVYLAKDARLGPSAFRQMYPDLPKWHTVKRAIDPADRFSSSLSRRLGLTR